MSKKRTSAESNDDDEQTNEGSDSVLQNKDNTKRAKLTSLISDTTLQDLPIELLGCILVKVVAMEVKGMKLAKSVWKEKAGPVITRLEEVCSQWSSILTTDFFRNEVNRVLDETDEEWSRLEILHHSPIQFDVSDMTTLNDEILLLFRDQVAQAYVIHVYDRNNMAEVKDVIQLPRNNPEGIAACSVSSCVYVLYMDYPGLSILRITKDEEHQFKISPWISDHELDYAHLSVSPNGSLLIFSNLVKQNPPLVCIYDANGILQRKIRFFPHIYGFKYLDRVFEKSNGNLVVVSTTDQFKTKLTEISINGRIIRQYQSNKWLVGLKLADIYGRILIAASYKRIELFLDSEFNPLNFIDPELDEEEEEEEPNIPQCWQYNSTRNEIVTVDYDDEFENGVLTIFRLTEE